MSDNQYQKYVELGKQSLGYIKDYQMTISRYALAVCDIRHGGPSKNIYTIGKYAEDIGMNQKTLQNWIAIYRDVVKKLDKDEKEVNWSSATKVSNLLREEQTGLNKVTGKEKTITGYKKNVEPKRIRTLYEKIEDGEKPFESEFQSICQRTKHAKFLLKKRDLEIINDHQKLYLMELLDECSDLINDHLTSKSKRAS